MAKGGKSKPKPKPSPKPTMQGGGIPRPKK